MGDVLQHSKSSASKFGGAPSDYFFIHEILDSSKLFLGDWRHRTLLHNTFGIYLLEKYIIGTTFKRKSDDVEVCTRTVATAHILEDLGVLLTPAEFLREMPIRSWMSRVDTKTKVRLQRMSIAGSEEPTSIEETIFWFKYPDSRPEKNGVYLVSASDKAGKGFVWPAAYDVDIMKFASVGSTDVMFDTRVVRWADFPIGVID